MLTFNTGRTTCRSAEQRLAIEDVFILELLAPEPGRIVVGDES